MATVQQRKWTLLRRLTPEQVDQIRALPWERGSAVRLARELGVSKALISNIRNGLVYKRKELPQQTYLARVTDQNERYFLGSFLTPEAAQNAINNFPRTSKYGRGSIGKTTTGRYRARLSLGVYQTRRAAEQAIEQALEKLSAPSGALEEEKRK